MYLDPGTGMETPYVSQLSVHVPTFIDRKHIHDASTLSNHEFEYADASRTPAMFQPRRHDLVFSIPSNTFLHQSDPGVFASFNGVQTIVKDNVRFQGIAVAPVHYGYDNFIHDPSVTIQVKGSATILNTGSETFFIGDTVAWEYPVAGAAPDADGRIRPVLVKFGPKTSNGHLVGRCIKGGTPNTAIEVLIGERN